MVTPHSQLPLAVVAIGAVGVAMAWLGARRPRLAGAGEAISEPPAATGLGCVLAFLYLFCGSFLLAGAAVFFFVTVKPAFRIASAADWPERPCQVLSSRVRTVESSDSLGFSVDILYSYRVGDRDYRSNRYGFGNDSSNVYLGKDAIVARYPAGTTCVCYVNPSDPSDAVLERGFTANLLFGLIGLPFVLIGLGGFALTFFLKRRSRSPQAPWRAPDAASVPLTVAPVRAAPRRLSWQAPAAAPGPVRIEPAQSRIGKLVFLAMCCVLWNGLVLAFAAGAVLGGGGSCVMLFLVPFGLVGLGLVYATVHQLLALFNPRPVITLSVGRIRLGDSATISWEFSGRVARIRHLRIWLEGREEATCVRGTTTYTDKNVFLTRDVLVTDASDVMRAGSERFAIPSDAMHTFRSSNNKVLWTLRLEGEIAHWPDVAEEYEIEVLPRRLASVRERRTPGELPGH